MFFVVVRFLWQMPQLYCDSINCLWCKLNNYQTDPCCSDMKAWTKCRHRADCPESCSLIRVCRFCHFVCHTQIMWIIFEMILLIREKNDFQVWFLTICRPYLEGSGWCCYYPSVVGPKCLSYCLVHMLRINSMTFDGENTT